MFSPSSSLTPVSFFPGYFFFLFFFRPGFFIFVNFIFFKTNITKKKSYAGFKAVKKQCARVTGNRLVSFFGLILIAIFKYLSFTSDSNLSICYLYTMVAMVNICFLLLITILNIFLSTADSNFKYLLSSDSNFKYLLSTGESNFKYLLSSDSNFKYLLCTADSNFKYLLSAAGSIFEYLLSTAESN